MTEARDTITAIVNVYSAYRDLVGIEVATGNRIFAICRRLHAVAPGSGKSEESKAEKAAERAFRSVLAGKVSDEFTDRAGPFNLITIGHLMDQKSAAHEIRRDRAKDLSQLAKQLPVWPWAESIRGLGALSLAQMIGEGKCPLDFPTVRRYWRYCSLGFTKHEKDGEVWWEIQRKRTGDAALAEAYSPRRRSVFFVIGDNLVRAKGDYYPLYLERKALEVEKNEARPEGERVKPWILHRRAKRYVEKRLLRDHWLAWRGLEPIALNRR